MSESFLRRPDRDGPIGALCDESARAASEFCDLVERIPQELFVREHECDDPDTQSIRTICAHVIGAAHRHADYIRKALELPVDECFRFTPERLENPLQVRDYLAEQIRYLEETVEGLHSLAGEKVLSLTFKARWGPIYDPEMMLEHAIVHLLRHRRQIARWPGVNMG